MTKDEHSIVLIIPHKIWDRTVSCSDATSVCSVHTNHQSSHYYVTSICNTENR